MAAQRFLVPIDFSECANQALDYAITLAGKLGARLTLLHVIQPLPLGGVDMGVTLPFASVQDLEAETQRNMASALERVTAAGHPAETIVRVAHERGADLIVMGTHGRTGLPHVLLGSVAEKVVQLAPCPVLTVRRAP